MSALGLIYTTSDGEAAEIRCHEHPEWWADADGTDLPGLIKAAVQHLRDDHRKHKRDCLCADRVIDQRCVPRIDWAEVAR